MSIPRRAGFEENRGQWPDAVAYVARDGAATLFLTATEAVWRLRERDDRAAADHATGDYVRMRWLGANPAAEIVATQPQSPRVNYVHGNDPHAWRTGIPLYGRVTYRNLYPGIDLVFHDERGALEYDLVVAPGADPTRIRLALEGPLKVVRDQMGELTVETSAGDIIHRRPVVYQDDAEQRRDVSAHYRVRSRGAGGAPTEIGFSLGQYDRTRAVVIDPRVAYQTKIDSATDTVIDAAVDANGNLWVVGSTASPDFPSTDDAIQPDQAAFDDGYVVKLDAQGRLVYATYLGGGNLDCMGGVALDADGNVVVGGTTASDNFPVTGDAAQGTNAGGQGDGFLTKLDPDGALIYSSYFGGTGYDACNSRGIRWSNIAAIPGGGIYFLIGTTTSSEFPAPGAVGDNLNANIIVARFDSTLHPVWGRFLGSPAYIERSSRVAADAAGNAYVLGVTGHLLGEQHQFPTTPGAFQTDSEADQVHFVGKYSPDGTLVYATFLGPTMGPSGSGSFVGDLSVDPAGNAYVAMVAGANMPVTPGAFQPNPGGGSDVYVGKLDPTGAQLLYGTYLGGSGGEQGDGERVSIAVDGEGHAYVAGATLSNDFPLRDAFESRPSSLFLTKFAPDGTDVMYSSYARQGVQALAVRNGAVHACGVNYDGFGIGVLKVDDAGAAPCAGDCDGDGVVRVNELVIGVGIALGQQPTSACPAFDANGDGQVTIAELIAAVGALLAGCT